MGIGRIVGVLRVALVVALLGATVRGTLVLPLHAWDVRLPVFGVGMLVAAPGWALLALAARARGAPWGWLVVAAARGASAAVWLSLTGEVIVGSLVEAIGGPTGPPGPAAEGLPSAIVAPLAEEPTKLLGVWIVVAAARRARAPASVALGAAIGGLVGLFFGVAEAAHHLGVIVGELGVVDLQGAFLIDWRFVQLFAEQQLVHKLFFFGLTNHALVSALAGAGLALLIQRRWRAGMVCLGAALLAHGVVNAIGVPITQFLIEVLVLGAGPIPRGVIPLLLGGWLAALGTFLVTEGWAAILLLRVLRGRSGARADPGPARPDASAGDAERANLSPL
jgi:RsiW-degrading membrane proteinase PrsW (M82 family)